MSYEKSAQLTEREINHRLKKEIVNAPIFLSSMVGTSLGLVAAVLFTTSNLFLPVVIVAGVCASTMLGYITLKTTVGKHKSMLKIIEKVKVETEEERKIIQEQVQSGLIKFEDKAGLQQLDQLKTKFNSFNSVLDLQFDKDEVTHMRYLTSGEQLYFGAVDNLRRLVILFHSIEAINPQIIKKQLQGSLDKVSEEALLKRLSIFDNAKEDMSKVLSVNELVMTKLDEVTRKLGSIQTREGLSNVRLDTALSEILHLINRTDKYDIRNN